MPETGGGAFEVSREEERYLRRAFLRFAAPYLIALAALVLLALASIAGLAQRDDAAGPRAAAALEAARAAAGSERAALQQQLGDATARLAALEQAQAKATEQLSALERRAQRGAASVDAASVSELRDAWASASERIEALEHRAGSASGASAPVERELLEALRGLEARIARVEQDATGAFGGPSRPASPER